MKEYHLSKDVAKLLTSDPTYLHLFEETVQEALNDLDCSSNPPSENIADVRKTIASSVSKWICNEYMSLLNSMEDDLSEDVMNITLSMTSQQLGQLIAMIHDETISKRTAKQILRFLHKQYWDTKCQNNKEETQTKQPRDIANEKGWNMISDPSQIRSLCLQTIHKFDSHWEQYKEGDDKKKWKMEKFLMGKVMTESGGNVHPEKMKTILKKVLEGH